MSKTTHTPGPIAVWNAPDEHCDICSFSDEITKEQLATAKLLAASYTSYDRHFGPNAVEAAEGDALGTGIDNARISLDLLGRIMRGRPVEKSVIQEQRDRLAAFLARTETK